MKTILVLACCLFSICAADMALAQVIDQEGDALEFSIMAYQHGELYAGVVFDTTTQRMSSFSVGEDDGAYGWYMVGEYGEQPGGQPDWIGPELARFGNDLQQVRFHGATFTFYSAVVDWIEIEVRGCLFADLMPYLPLMDLSQGLDEGITNKLFRPMGRLAFAANHGAPVPWPEPELSEDLASDGE